MRIGRRSLIKRPSTPSLVGSGPIAAFSASSIPAVRNWLSPVPLSSITPSAAYRARKHVARHLRDLLQHPLQRRLRRQRQTRLHQRLHLRVELGGHALPAAQLVLGFAEHPEGERVLDADARL
jgi:hypothetical protein